MMKLTLAKTWQLCLRMWKWIAKEMEKDNKLSIWNLKDQWLEEHKFQLIDIVHSCFFCEYNTQQGGEPCDCQKDTACSLCPGKLVSKSFKCNRKTYSYSKKPIQFYKKLVELNNKRLEQNKKRRKK